MILIFITSFCCLKNIILILHVTDYGRDYGKSLQENRVTESFLHGTVSSNNHQNTAHVPTAHSQVILPVSLPLPVQSAAERKCLRQESKILWSSC